MPNTSEIKYDDLDYQPEGVFLLNSEPFTGVTIDRDTHGMKIAEVPFLDGRQHGVVRSWHGNGQISVERSYVLGESHGTASEWFDDGNLMSRTEFEFGVIMRRELFDRQGTLMEVFERQPSDVLYQNVVQRRTQC